ncbi:hypothetical protein M885DRAFT_487255 [Pelagophyceae sp. CCMP2097]|nr:hypothetical protein M885DRAFT_487255 [Pelagophyceae sp. CCMP2097]
MLAAACALAEQADWESRIEWGDGSDDDDAAGGDDDPALALEALLAPAAGPNARVANGNWVQAIRWGDDDDNAAVARQPQWLEDARRQRRRAAPPACLIDVGAGGALEDCAAYVEVALDAGVAAKTSADKMPQVKHSLPAQLHRFVMPDLAPAAQLLFHRPRLPKNVLKSKWRLRGAAPDVDGAGAAATATRAALRRRGGGGASLHAVMRETELRADGGDLLLLEFAEEQPPLVANVGMAAALVHVVRARNGRRPGAKGAEVLDDDVPGFRVTLGADDEAPIFAALPPGDGASQAAWVSELFRAPVFRHAPRGRDFLLVMTPRRRKRKDDSAADVFDFVARDLAAEGHAAYVCGQTEPRVEVPPRGSKRYHQLQEPIAAFHVARAFQSARASQDAAIRELALPLDELQRALFCNTRITQALLKRAVGEVLEKHRTEAGVDVWRSPLEAAPVDADDVATRFAPEDVCAYEATNAHYRALHALGLAHPEKLGGPGGAAIAVQALHRACAAALRRASELRQRARAAASRFTAARPDDVEGAASWKAGISMADVAHLAEQRARALERHLGAARRIHEALALAPTHLSSGFCDVRHRAAAHAVLRLDGLGDPTGRGEGFSFARTSLRHGAFAAPAGRRGAGNVDAEKVSLAESKRRYAQRVEDISARQRNWLSATALRDDDGDVQAFDDDIEVVRDKLKRKKKKDTAVDTTVVTVVDKAATDKAALLAAALGTDTVNPPAPAAPAAAPAAVPAPVPAPAPADKDSDEDEDDSDHDLSDLEKDLEDDIVGNQEASAATAHDDAGELAKLRAEMAAEKAAKTSQQRLADQLAAGAGDQRRLPYAVRRVRRWVDAAGVERCRVSFSVDPAEVHRVAQATGARLVSQRPRTPQPANTARDAASRGQPPGARPGQAAGARARPSAPAPAVQGAAQGGVLAEGLDFLGDLDYLDEEGMAPDMADDGDAPPTPGAAGGATFKFAGSSQLRDAPVAPPPEASSKAGGTVKLNFSAMLRKEDQFKADQRLKKSQKAHEEAQSYARRTKKKSRSQATSRHELPHVRLSKLLDEAVVKPLFLRPHSGAFHRPVNPKVVPEYREKVERPVDLTTIRERLSRYTYRDRSKLVAEFELMAHNAVIFNGAGSVLADEAAGILADVRKKCAEIHADLDDLEKETRDATAQQTSKRQRRPAKGESPPTKRARPGAAPPAEARPGNSARDAGAKLGTADGRAAAADDDADDDAGAPKRYRASRPDAAPGPAKVAPPAPGRNSPVPPGRNSPAPPTLAAMMGGDDSSSSSGEEELQEEFAI